ALALRKDVKHPFPPESDEVAVAGKEKKDGEKDEKKEGDKKDDDKKANDKKEGEKKEKKDEPPKPVTIDFDNLAARVARVPVPADDYQGLSANKEALFYVKSSAPYYGRDAESKPVLTVFALKARKASPLVEDVNGYT